MKICHECGNELVVGENWSPSRVKKCDYLCLKCAGLRNAAKRKGLERDKILARDKVSRKRRKEQRQVESKAWREANLKRVAANNLKRRNITLANYDTMLNAQGGRCAICGKTPEENGKRLAVDHDHGTGEIRGLLCDSCNRGLGLFRDNPQYLQVVAFYLR